MRVSIKRALCTIWGHVWEAIVAVQGGKVIIAERCSKCQVWK